MWVKNSSAVAKTEGRLESGMRQKNGATRMVVLPWDRLVRKSVVRWEQGYCEMGKVIRALEFAQAVQKVAAWCMSKVMLGLQNLSLSNLKVH